MSILRSLKHRSWRRLWRQSFRISRPTQAVPPTDRRRLFVISRSPLGFHAQILAPTGAIYVDPFLPADNEFCIVYYRRDYRKKLDHRCLFQSEGPQKLQRARKLAKAATAARTGTQLRTYRLACATSGEYTQFHGGTASAGMAAVVTAINRVTGIYEVELSIRLELVANNNLLIYTDPNTDPYTNSDAFALLTENQNNCDAVIGSANYDVGHVFTTGGGGLAGLGGGRNRRAEGARRNGAWQSRRRSVLR